jgi:hypothetical protein
MLWLINFILELGIPSWNLFQLQEVLDERRFDYPGNVK